MELEARPGLFLKDPPLGAVWEYHLSIWRFPRYQGFFDCRWACRTIFRLSFP